MEDTHSTSIAAFMVEDKFVVIGTDSRRCSFTNYGTVYGKDDWIKIHHICCKIYGAGSGSFNMVDKVFNEARELWKNNPPPNGVKQVAQSVATIAQKNKNPEIKTSFVVGGWIAGQHKLYSVLSRLKDRVFKNEDTTAETKSEKTEHGDAEEEGEILLGSGDVIHTTAERTSEKRKAPDAEEEEDKYEYKAVEETEVVLGSGKKLMLETLRAKRRANMYPLTASTSLEEAKNLIRDLMRDPLNRDFCSDGKLRVLSLSEDGMVGHSTAEIVGLGGVDGDQDRFYGDWIEGRFDVVGEKNP